MRERQTVERLTRWRFVVTLMNRSGIVLHMMDATSTFDFYYYASDIIIEGMGR